MDKTAQINLQPSHVRVYRYIQKYIAKNIVSPEIQEISKGTHTTIRHTYRLVDTLVMLGYLSRNSYKKRSLKIEKPLQ